MTIKITKTAQNPSTARTPSFFYNSARDGMQEFLAHRQETAPGLRILLPRFIGWSPHEGSGVFDPVRNLNVATAFYRLHDDLSCDAEDVETLLAEGGPTVVVLIHYFGRTDPSLTRVAASAERHGAVLIEDLAHSFFTAHSGGLAGRFGSVLLFSLHKMFPTPDASGGMVTYRDASLVRDQRSTRPDLREFLLNYDWRRISELRRAHHDDLDRRLRDLQSSTGGFSLLWPDLPEGDVPQTLPVRIAGRGRDRIYRLMNDEGFGMVSLYHTLIPEVRYDTDMLALSQTIINFPLHQDMEVSHRQALVESFSRNLLAVSETQ